MIITLHRQEVVKLGKASGRAKLAGTLVGLGGAMVVTFYPGPEMAFVHRVARVAGLQHGDRHGHDLSRGPVTGGDAVRRRPGGGLVPRHRRLLQLRGLAVDPGAGRGGLPVPLLDRRAGVPLRRRPDRAARALLPPGRRALAARARRQALLLGLRGEHR